MRIWLLLCWVLMTLVPIQANASDIRPQIINGDRANVNDYASFASCFYT